MLMIILCVYNGDDGTRNWRNPMHHHLCAAHHGNAYLFANNNNAPTQCTHNHILFTAVFQSCQTAG